VSNASIVHQSNKSKEAKQKERKNMAKSTKVAKKTAGSTSLSGLMALGQQILDANEGGDGEFAPFAKMNGSTGEIDAKEHDFSDDAKALNIHSFVKGLVSWHSKLGQPPAGKEYRYLTQNPEPITEDILPDVPADCTWSPFINFTLKDMDNGQEFTFTCGNTSSVNAAKALLAKIFTPSHGEDLETRVPLVSVGQDSFETNKGNTVYKPVFTIEGWIDAEEGMFTSPIGESSI
jgi:hypothetical protein